MTRADKGYLAGIVDGEGCITVGNYDYGFYPVIRISNTHRRGMYEIAELVSEIVRHPVKVYSQDYEKRNPRWKPGWVIAIKAHYDVLQIIEAVLPHLRFKKQQATLLLGHLRWRREQAVGKGRKSRPQDVLDKDTEIAKVLHALNRPGKMYPRVCTDYTETSQLSPGEDIVASPA